MSKPTPPNYRTTNWRSYNAALKQRGSLLIWFDPETQWLGAPSGKRGRSATFSDAAIQASLTLKALFGLPLGSVAQISRDSLRDSRMLVGVHRCLSNKLSADFMRRL